MVARRTPPQPASGRRVSRSASSSSSSSSSTSQGTSRAPPVAGRACGRRGNVRDHSSGDENGFNGVVALNGVILVGDDTGGNGLDGNNGVTGNNADNGGGANDPSAEAMSVDSATTSSKVGTTATNIDAPPSMAATAATTTMNDPLFPPPPPMHAQMPAPAAPPSAVAATNATFLGEGADADNTVDEGATGADTRAADGVAGPTIAGVARTPEAGTQAQANPNGGGRSGSDETTASTFGFMAPTMPGTGTWFARLRHALGRGWMVPRTMRRSTISLTALDAAATASTAPPAPPPSPMATTMPRMSNDSSRAQMPPPTRASLDAIREVVADAMQPSPPPSGAAHYRIAHPGGWTTYAGVSGLPQSRVHMAPKITPNGFPMASMDGLSLKEISALVAGSAAASSRAATTTVAADPTDYDRADAARAAAVARAVASHMSTATIKGNPAAHVMPGSHASGTLAGLSIDPAWLPYLTLSSPAAGAAAAMPPAPTAVRAAPATTQKGVATTAAGRHNEAPPSGMVTPPPPVRRGNQRPGTPHPAPLRGRHLEPPMMLYKGLQPRVPTRTSPPLVGRRGKAHGTTKGAASTTTTNTTGRTASHAAQTRAQTRAKARAQTRAQTRAQARSRAQALTRAQAQAVAQAKALGQALGQAMMYEQHGSGGPPLGADAYEAAAGAPGNDREYEPRGPIVILTKEIPDSGPGHIPGRQVLAVVAEAAEEGNPWRLWAWDAGLAAAYGMDASSATEAVQATVNGDGMAVWPVDASPMAAMEAAAQANGGNGGDGNGSEADWVVDGTPMSPTTVSPPSSMRDTEEEDEMWTTNNNQ